MDEQHDRTPFLEMMRVADRLESLAETAALMDDQAGALRLRTQASNTRLRAMALLDD